MVPCRVSRAEHSVAPGRGVHRSVLWRPALRVPRPWNGAMRGFAKRINGMLLAPFSLHRTLPAAVP